MGRDVIQIGLNHNLPVHDRTATAKGLSKRLNTNIRLLARVDYKYDEVNNTVIDFCDDDIILGEFKINENDDFLNVYACRYVAEMILQQIGLKRLQELSTPDSAPESVLEDLYGAFYEMENPDFLIYIYEENVELDVSIVERYTSWESWIIRNEAPYKDWVRKYREQIHERAKVFGCKEVIICADEGPTSEIYGKMNIPSQELKKYALEAKYYDDYCSAYPDRKYDFNPTHKIIDFPSYFCETIDFANIKYIDVVFDDFSDLQ